MYDDVFIHLFVPKSTAVWKTDICCCFKIQSLIGKSVTLYKVPYFSLVYCQVETPQLELVVTPSRCSNPLSRASLRCHVQGTVWIETGSCTALISCKQENQLRTHFFLRSASCLSNKKSGRQKKKLTVCKIPRKYHPF